MKEQKNDYILPQFWNGYCPESHLKGKKVKMRLNKFDFYESEETGLQICMTHPGVIAVILNFRGEGDFRETESYAYDAIISEFLSPQNIDGFPFNEPTEIFKSSEETEAYIKEIK